MRPCKLSPGKLPFVVAIALSLGFSAAVRSSAAQDSAVSSGPIVSRIVSRIDESHLVTLKGSTHPLANARNDRGAAPESMQLDRMHLVLKRSDSQETALRQLINDMHTAGTSSYHKWLTPDQFGKQFGPSDQDVAIVETWLTQHGFNVSKVNPGKQTIEFTGNVGQLRSAFHTQIHKYEVNGETHYANAGDPQIPAALAPVVGGFVALNNFRVNSHTKVLGKATYDPKTDKATPLWTTGNSSALSFALAPADYAIQYDLGPLYTAGTNGAGQTIAIVNNSNINVDLVNQFRTLFSLPFNPPQVIVDGNDPGIDGINNPDGPNGDSIEAYLDVEWSGAVAPAATIDLVLAADTSIEGGLFLAAERAVYSNIAPIISLSFGACEANIGSTNSFLNNLWEQAAAQGITVMVSTGDAGSAGCDNDNVQEYAVNGAAVSGFASTPYNVAVGGTDFYYSAFSGGLNALAAQLPTYWNETPSNSTPAASILGVIPEQPWNASQFGLTISTLAAGSSPTSTSIAGGSGGASTLYTKPAWQKGAGVPADGHRDIPDVSLFASSGSNASFYPECFQDGDCQPASSGGTVQITGVGGTSASAPAFAGIMALVNQKYGRQGQADFVLYPLATQFPLAFHDVIAGTNSVPCNIDATSAGQPASPDCIAVTPAVTVDDPNFGTATEGQIGTGTTAEYNATLGYDLATGLGTIDANVLVTNWANVKFTPTTTTLTPSKTSFAHGTAITVSGSVTASGATPTGDVALVTSSTEPVQQGQTFFTLSGGAYTGSVDFLPGGTYNIWGQYGGDGVNATSSSNPVSITVTPETSTLNFSINSPIGTYTPSAPPTANIDYGTQMMLSAQPAPASSATSFTFPTGTVAFTDGSTLLNTAVVNAEGDAEYNAPFSVGAHSVTAAYSGDQSYNKSTASAIKFTVVKDTPVIIVGSSFGVGQFVFQGGQNQPTVVNVLIENQAINSLAGQNAIYPVPVAAPTGTLTVSGFPSGVPTSATLAAAVDPTTGAPDGVATFTIPAGATGNYNVNISYAGDANYAATSAAGTITVQAPSGGLASSTTATLTGSTISPTTNISIAGTVTGQTGHAAPTGGIYIYSSGNYITEIGLSAGTGDVSNFAVTLNSQRLFQGANFVTLQYSGDGTYNPSAFAITNPNPITSPLSDFTLVPNTTIVPISLSGGANSGTVTVNVGSANGFAGAVNLTCTTAPGITCSIPASVTLTSGGSTTATLTINAPADTANLPFNVLVTGTDSTGTFVHTAAVQASISGSVAGSSSFALVANPASLSLALGASTGNTSTITVSPEGAFTSAVNLSCAVTSPAGATSPATCALASASVASGSGSDVLTVTTTSSTTAGAYSVTVTGTSGSLTQTAVVAVTVAMPNFTLSNSGAITVAPGATTGNTSTITITALSGFSGTVNLSCAISPAAATDPATCSIPATVSVTGSTATATLSVSTTAATSALTKPKDLFWPSAGGVALALVVFLGIPARKRNWPALLGLLVLFVSAGAIGCGGGGGSGGGGGGGGGGSTGTTAGTYTVTVTATAGSITQTTPVTLTVN